MKKSDWVWMPHAGHFILGNKCKFHLSTYVGGFVVSTVGELWNERAVREIHARVDDMGWFMKNGNLKGAAFDRAYMERFGYDEIGHERKYETMVFVAKKSNNICCPWTMASADNKDSDVYNDSGEAYRGHLKMCLRWSKK